MTLRVIKAIIGMLFAIMIMFPLEIFVMAKSYSQAGNAIASFLHQVAYFLQFVYVMAIIGGKDARRNIRDLLAWLNGSLRTGLLSIFTINIGLCFVLCGIVPGLLFTTVTAAFCVLLKCMLNRVQKT